MDDEDEKVWHDGTLEFYSQELGYGYIIPNDGGDSVFLSKEIANPILSSLDPNVPLLFRQRKGETEPYAIQVEFGTNFGADSSGYF